jgi:hypothetical protein
MHRGHDPGPGAAKSSRVVTEDLKGRRRLDRKSGSARFEPNHDRCCWGDDCVQAGRQPAATLGLARDGANPTQPWLG